MPKYLDIDTPLPPPTYRSLIPAYVFGYARLVFKSLEALEAMPEVRFGNIHDARDRNLPIWRTTSARYGETQGVIVLRAEGKRFQKGDCNTQEGWTYDGPAGTPGLLLAIVDGKPVMQTFFDDPYYNLALERRAVGEGERA